MQKLTLPQIDLVIGIGSGGIVPATMVAHQLGCNLKIVHINYRDEHNQPRFEHPTYLSYDDDLGDLNQHVLLVDDVSVSGKTLSAARELLPHAKVTTLVCKGKADHVLFPEVSICVQWPWKGSFKTSTTLPQD